MIFIGGTDTQKSNLKKETWLLIKTDKSKKKKKKLCFIYQ